VTSKTVDEAVAKKADLIVSHHPVIFKGLKRINEDDPKGNIIYKLIRTISGCTVPIPIWMLPMEELTIIFLDFGA